jgi:hypothetical protein
MLLGEGVGGGQNNESTGVKFTLDGRRGKRAQRGCGESFWW